MVFRRFVSVGVAIGVFLLWADAGRARTPDDIAVIAFQIDDLMTLDPAEVYELSGIEVVANVYDRLVERDPGNPSAFKGSLAESWSVSPDGRTFAFTLRRGVRFPSGHELTAVDAAWSLQRVLRLDKGPAFLLKGLGLNRETAGTAIRSPDDHTLVIETGRPLAPGFVLDSLATWAASVLDRREVEAHAKGDDLGNGWLRRTSAGSGAFRVTLWRPNEALILDRNASASSWRQTPASSWRQTPAMRRVVLRHVPEPATQRLLLEKGDVDIARNIGPDDLPALSAHPAIRVRPVPQASIYYLGLNQKNPYLARPQVRQALKHLVDYGLIRDTLLKGTKTVHQTVLPEGIDGALDERPFAYDPAKARALLAEAGLADGFPVTMDARNTPPTTDIAQALQAMWAKAGIRLEILPGDNKQTLTRYRARAHDIYIGRWAPDGLDPHSNAQAFAWNPDNRDGAGDKTLAWRNSWETPDTSRLVERALAETDPARRRALYVELQRLCLKSSPFVILFQDADPVAERTDVTGFTAGPTSDDVSYRGIRKSRGE
ncbi:MAG: ABC transporter substrate-binding protein [Alphaproteobacteria bacterium]|nr:ABC transporter substrate-binding protein [Alphaproteobacteria bacterium]